MGPRRRCPVPPERSEAVPLHGGSRTRARQSHSTGSGLFCFVFFFFSAQLISFLLSRSRLLFGAACAVVRASARSRLLSHFRRSARALSLFSLENGCVGERRREGGERERERGGARVLRRRLLPPSGERHSRRSGRVSFASPPPSRSVPFGPVGSAVSRSSVTVWVRRSVASGFFVLHLSAFAARSFQAPFFLYSVILF